jgi:hypothetical protein
MANKPSSEELKNGLSEMQFYVTQITVPNRLSPDGCCTTRKMACTTAWCAMRRCSLPDQVRLRLRLAELLRAGKR